VVDGLPCRSASPPSATINEVEPLRGEIWDVRIPIVVEQPAVVMTINPMISRLGSVTIAVITGTAGPAPIHVPLDAEAELTCYEVSHINATDLHSVDQSRLKRRRGRLHPAELQRLEAEPGCPERRCARWPWLVREGIDSLEQVTQPIGVIGEESGREVDGDGFPDDLERHRSKPR
jgi:mRNA interferase MazF